MRNARKGLRTVNARWMLALDAQPADVAVIPERGGRQRREQVGDRLHVGSFAPGHVVAAEDD